MATILFLMFAGTCITLLLMIVTRPERLYEFPYFMGAAFAGFFLPQAYGILVSASYPEEWKTALFLQSFLCVGCCWIGYNRTPKGKLIQRLQIRTNPSRFAIAGAFLILFGSVFDHMIAGLPPEKVTSQGTGIFTIYLFFAQQVYTGFAICFYSALIYRKKIYWIMSAVGSISPAVTVLFYGRREPAALMTLTIALVVFFAKRITPPGWAIAMVLGLATLLIPATTVFRHAQATGENGFEALTNVDYSQLFASYSDPTVTSEVKNAMYIIQASMTTGVYGFGVNYWNRIVFSFVPAQFVGKTIKDGLMIGDRSKDPEVLAASTGFQIPVGSTITCVGDTFEQFWFFGGVVYAVTAFFFRNLWISATVSENPIVRIFYIQSMVGAMRSVSHGSFILIPVMIYSAMFLFFVILYARVRPNEA